MIELTGTDKEITWANDIRDAFIVNCDKVVARIQSGKAEYVHPKVRARFCELVRERQALLLAHFNEAKDYIANRASLTFNGIEHVIAVQIKDDENAQAAMAAPRQREAQ